MCYLSTEVLWVLSLGVYNSSSKLWSIVLYGFMHLYACFPVMRELVACMVLYIPVYMAVYACVYMLGMCVWSICECLTHCITVAWSILCLYIGYCVVCCKGFCLYLVFSPWERVLLYLGSNRWSLLYLCVVSPHMVLCMLKSCVLKLMQVFVMSILLVEFECIQSIRGSIER